MAETLGLTSNTYASKNFLWSTDNVSEKGITILSGEAAMVPGTVVIRQNSSGKYRLFAVHASLAAPESLYTSAAGGETFVHELVAANPNIKPGSVVITYEEVGGVRTITCNTYSPIQSNAYGTVYIDYKNGRIALSMAAAELIGTDIILTAYDYYATGLDFAEPLAIVTESIDASAADQEVTALITGHVYGNKLTPTITTDYYLRELLRSKGIIVHVNE